MSFFYRTKCKSKIFKKISNIKTFQNYNQYSNSSEFKGKLENGNNSAAEFDTKFINIAELLTKSDSTQRFL